MSNSTNHSKKKKISYVITRSDIGGAQFHTLQLLREFQQEYDVSLITGSNGMLAERALDLGVSTTVIPKLDSYNGIVAIFQIARVLKRQRPDIVHVHSSLASFYGRVAAKMCGLRTLYTVHGWHFSHEPSLFKRSLKIGIEHLLKNLTTYWVTVSKFDRKLGEMHNLFRPDSVRVIANGVAECPPTTDTLNTDNSLNIVFVGRATYQKNCEAAIRVLELCDQRINLTMYASGDAIERIKILIENSSASERLRLIVNEPNAGMLLGKYSALLQTSRYEGMPLSALEAMRSGVPIISTDVCGMNEVVIDGVNGYLFPEDNETLIAKQLDELLKDRDKLAHMGQESRRLFESHFTQTKMINSIAHLYKHLMP